MGKKYTTVSGTAYLGLAVFLIAMSWLSGCGGGSTTTSASGQTSQNEGTPSRNEGAPLAVGDTCATTKAEVTVKKVSTTGNLDSPEATALLVTGEAGEQTSHYGDKGTAKSGNEFLMVTMNFKNINAKPPVINPSGLKLKNGQGQEYQEVSTGGYGGVYNMPQVEPGKDRQVTAVYEVPRGETGLVLTYQPYGEPACNFNVR